MRGSRPLTADETRRVKESFSGRMAERNRAIFSLGINTGFRISEMLSLTIGDVLEETGHIKDRVTVARRNMKRARSGRTVLLNKQSKAALRRWLVVLQRKGFIHRDDFIFYSDKKPGRPITRTHAWSIMHEQYKKCGLTGKLGTHAMRKTFANNVFEFFLDMAAKGKRIEPFRSTSKALGHTDINSTDKYLSFRVEDIDQAIISVGI